MRLLFVNQKPLIFLKACLQLSSLKPQRYFFNFYLNSQGQTVTYKFYSRHLMSVYTRLSYHNMLFLHHSEINYLCHNNQASAFRFKQVR